MDTKTLVSTLIGAAAAVATGFGLSDATTIQTLAAELTTAATAIIAIVGIVGTVFFHKQAVANTAINAAVTGSTVPDTTKTAAVVAHTDKGA